VYGVDGARFRERRAWVLAMAGLGGREHALTGELPLGFKQRLALGCAVLHQPPVLFLDEPTSGVDPLARRAFWRLIAELAQAGTTVLVSTHYMEEAEHCSRLLLMNRGRVIAGGTPAELRGSMTEPIYEVDTDDAAAAVEALMHAPGIVEAAMFGRSVHLVAEDALSAERVVAEELTRAGRELRGIRRVAPRLEDVFVASVRRAGGALVD
jgi:ABC-2 type transport system ATP-binding protein